MTSTTLLEHLHTAIGGDWHRTAKNAPVQGAVAVFPRFRSDATVGVLNAYAAHAGAKEQVVALKAGLSADMLGQDPQSPRQVIVPEGLLQNSDFVEALAATDPKAQIMHQIARQLQHGVGQGLSR